MVLLKKTVCIVNNFKHQELTMNAWGEEGVEDGASTCREVSSLDSRLRRLLHFSSLVFTSFSKSSGCMDL